MNIINVLLPSLCNKAFSEDNGAQILKWLTPYQRRLVRKMVKTGKKVHNGRKYIVLIDDAKGLIIINDVINRKRYILIGKPSPKQIV